MSKKGHKPAQRPARAKKPNRTQPRANRYEFSSFTFSAGHSGLLSFTNLVAAVRSCKRLIDVLGLVDLRLEDFGAALGHTPQFKSGRPQGFSKGYISQLSGGRRPVSPRMIKAIECVLQSEISQLLGRPIGIKVSCNSPWSFRLAALCDEHGPYELIGQRRHCPVCGK